MSAELRSILALVVALAVAGAAIVAFGDATPRPAAAADDPGADAPAAAVETAVGAPGARRAVTDAAPPAADAVGGVERRYTLRVTVVRGELREPQAGVRVDLLRFGRVVPLARATTADDGTTGFAALPPGRFTVRTGADDVRLVSLDAAAPSTVDVELAIPDYADVVGRVVDSEGRAVPAARILVADGRIDDRPRVAAITDATGSFRVAVHTPLPTIQAEADGRVRSVALQPECFRGPPVRLELVVGTTGAELRGIVLDADGRPVDGARIEVMDTRPPPGAGAPPAVGTAGLTVVHTGADGRFACAGLGEGVARWRVRSTRRAVAGGVIQLDGGATRELEIRLERRARIEGRVLGLDGRPRAGVQVRPGPTAGFGPHTDEDGRFAIEDLSPGPVTLVALHPEHGGVEHTIEVTADAVARTELRLDPSGAVRGRVVGPDGEPLAGLIVRAAAQPGQVERTVVTAADGRFRFAGCRAPLPRLAVTDDLAAGRAPLGEWTDIAVDGPERVFAVDPRPGARVRGQVLRPAGFEHAAVQLLIQRLPARLWSFRVGAAADDGSFRTPELPPGRYRIAAVPWGSELAGTEPHELEIRAGDREIDLGTMTLPTPTALRIEPGIVGSADVPRALELTVTAMDAAAERIPLRWRGDRLIDIPRLRPGRWRVSVRPGVDHLGVEQVVELLPGRVTRAAIALPAARRCRIELLGPHGERLGRFVLAELTRLDVDGAKPVSVPIHDGVGRVGVTAGRYRARVEDDGWAGAAEFAVDAVAGPEVRIALPMRPVNAR